MSHTPQEASKENWLYTKHINNRPQWSRICTRSLCVATKQEECCQKFNSYNKNYHVQKGMSLFPHSQKKSVALSYKTQYSPAVIVYDIHVVHGSGIEAISCQCTPEVGPSLVRSQQQWCHNTSVKKMQATCFKFTATGARSAGPATIQF